LAAAERDLAARFREERLPDPDFAWRGELALAARLAERGELARALEDAGAWWRLDGRFLFALGERAHAAGRDPAAARALLRAGLVALAGEPAPPADEVDRARFRLFALAWTAEAWEEFARLGRALLADQRALALSEAVWAEALGADDPAAGVDPRARLASALPQARAWAALSAGDLAGARGAAAEAEQRLGRSAAAREEQERLARAIAGR
jgi:hypothetical protein